VGLPDDEEIMTFDTIPARDRQTDGRRDGRTRCDRYYPR